jgi:hypothetical protein
METRSQYKGSNHPWFELIANIRSGLLDNKTGALDEAIERLGFKENEVKVEQEEQWEDVSNEDFKDATDEPQDRQEEGSQNQQEEADSTS